jgi:DnaK suppressor protein
MGASAEPQTNTGELNNSGYDIDPSYIPSDDEPFMNDRQLRYFQKQLVDWKNSILAESQGTLNQLQDGPMREPDLNDRASSETDWGIELRTRDRQRKLISKIESALRRITEGEYGYCQVTGEPISLARLRARPRRTAPPPLASSLSPTRAQVQALLQRGAADLAGAHGAASTAGAVPDVAVAAGDKGSCEPKAAAACAQRTATRASMVPTSLSTRTPPRSMVASASRRAPRADRVSSAPSATSGRSCGCT